MLFLLSNIFYYVGIPCIIVGSILIILIIYLLIKHLQKKHYYLERSKAHSEVLTCLGGIENVMSCKAVGSRLSLVLKDYNVVDEAKLKQLGVSSIIKMSNKITLVIGKEASEIANLIENQ